MPSYSDYDADRHDGSPTYRADPESPTIVFRDGFQAKGTNEDLQAHLDGDTTHGKSGWAGRKAGSDKTDPQPQLPTEDAVSTRQLHHVAVTLGDGCLSQAEIVVEELPSRDWTLVASIPGMPALRVDGDDLFECLRGLMRTVDSTAVRVLCNGARRDAWASGMLRDMNGASKVYLTNLGKPARRSDLAPIFGLAPVDHVGSVEEQDRFHREWLRSLEKGNG